MQSAAVAYLSTPAAINTAKYIPMLPDIVG
jgi:hypothetical protein